MATSLPGVIKAVVLGEGGVGKSCLVIQLVQNFFATDYDPTIENSYRKPLRIDDTVALLELLDTGGREEFSAMRDQYCRAGELFFFVYSITSRNSLLPLQEYRDQILRIKEGDYCPIVLMANKHDLEEERQIPKEEGPDLATSCGATFFFETSAKTRLNVEEAFMAGLRAALANPDPTRAGRTPPPKRHRADRCAII